MIIKINLLSTDKIAKEERNEYLAIGYAVITILLVVLLSNYLIKLRAYSKLETRIEKAQVELAKYQTIVAKVDALQATKKALETKKAVIDSLMASGLVYPKFMELFSRRTPPGIGIKTMTTTLMPDSSMNITLDADALDNYSIADFMSALTSDADFSLVELGAISSSGAAKSTAASFRLMFTYGRKKA